MELKSVIHFLGITITVSVPVELDDIEDGEVEEELGKLEEELLKEEEEQEIKIQEKQGSQALGPAQAQELADSLCQNLSSLNLEPEAA
jgi:hypothetical protein